MGPNQSAVNQENVLTCLCSCSGDLRRAGFLVVATAIFVLTGTVVYCISLTSYFFLAVFYTTTQTGSDYFWFYEARCLRVSNSDKEPFWTNPYTLKNSPILECKTKVEDTVKTYSSAIVYNYSPEFYNFCVQQFTSVVSGT